MTPVNVGAADVGVVPRVLVGRDGERAALGELVAALQAGVGGAALVVGEAGSGKSSLMAALLEEMGVMSSWCG